MNTPNEIPWFFSHVFPWPFVLAGCGMVYNAAREMLRAQLSHGWPTTDGEVVTSWVKKREADDDGTESYAAIIEYQYTLNGMTKTSDKIELAGGNGGSKASADAIVRRYPEESRVRVYYSPRDSDVAVLEPGMRWPHFSNLLVAFFFLFTGCAMLWAFGWIRWLVS